MVRRKIEITAVNGVEGKECGSCKIWKPLTDFHNSKSNLGGKAYSCRNCASGYRKIYNKENAERYHETYLKNIDKVKKYRKEKYEKERDEVLKARKEMTQEEREKINAQRRDRYPLHRDKYVANARKRRTKLSGLEDTLTLEQRQEILDFFKGCALTESSEFHWDHVIPISTGHGGTVYGNMIPLKEFFNISKKDRNIFEWFESNRQRFGLSQEKFNVLIQWLGNANGITAEEYRDYVYWCFENQFSVDDLCDNDEGEAI